MKKTGTFIKNILLFLCLIAAASFPLSATAAAKVSLAVYPFNDFSRNALDMEIHNILVNELSGYEFIELVPVEVIREKLFEIEPQFMWTAKEDSVKKGGILWKIEPRIIEKINEKVAARYSLYGELIRYGSGWSINAILIKDGDPGPFRSFRLTGRKDDDMQERLTGMSKSIADLLQKDSVLKMAEEDIRQYKGGMDSYSAVISKMKKYIGTVPESIPLRALLLDLYLEDKDGAGEEIMAEGLKIIDMLKQQEGADMRYLLSLALDPFDTVASQYEKRKEWKDAIAVRNRAFRAFPYNSELHKEGMGKDHYFLARSFEEEG
ncbi:MAG: hypothetical protein AB1499_11875, partial [Nitrospirota bacterium]